MRPVSMILLAAMAGMFLSCSEPLVTETFVRSSQRDADGCYRYCVDMSDSLSSYSLYFFTRIDGPGAGDRRDIRLHVDLVSPSGQRYAEETVIPSGSFRSNGRFTSDCYVPYRTGFVPAEYGDWMLSVTVDGEAAMEGFRGLGLRISRQKDR